MNSLFVISIASWIAMWIAFHLGNPVGYTIAIVGLAAAVAIAVDASERREEQAGIDSSSTVRTRQEANRNRAGSRRPLAATETSAALPAANDEHTHSKTRAASC